MYYCKIDSIYHGRLEKYFVAAHLDARGAEIKTKQARQGKLNPDIVAVRVKSTSLFSPLAAAADGKVYSGYLQSEAALRTFYGLYT